MKSLIVGAAALVLVASGCGVFGKSEALQAYEKFKEWERNGNCGEMGNLVEAGSQAQDYVNGLCAKVGGASAAGMIADMNATPAGAMRTFVFKVEKETKAGDTVTMEIRESVRGRSTAMNPLPPPRTYTVKAKKTGGAWKLVELPR